MASALDDSATTAAGVLLIVTPLAFNAAFAGLAARFDYPDILRRPTDEVLERFRAGGSGLVLLWWGFAMTAALLVPVAALTPASLRGADPMLVLTTAAVGVAAALVQLLGLIRWPFLVPHLAREAADPAATPARREAIDVVFQSFHRYLGVAVGEHLGYLLTGSWTVLVGVGMLQSANVSGWVGVAGIVIGAALALCSLEFVGPFEDRGWRPAAVATPAVYVAWSLWLVLTGVVLLL
jgi:Domain of unknown function (DUF4386)